VFFQMVQAWIDSDPFTTNKVWKRVRIEPVMLIYTSPAKTGQ
jgi:uncharacterized protein YciI